MREGMLERALARCPTHSWVFSQLCQIWHPLTHHHPMGRLHYFCGFFNMIRNPIHQDGGN